MVGTMALLMFIASGSASAGVAEVDLMVIPEKQPRWSNGDGAFQMTTWAHGFTSWGSVNFSADIMFEPGYSATPNALLLEVDPVLSIPRVFNFAMPKRSPLTDFGIAFQIKQGMFANDTPAIPLSALYGISLGFGGWLIDGLDVEILRRVSKPYVENYEIAYIDEGFDVTAIAYSDSWPYEASWNVGVTWYHTWEVGNTELYTRGFFDYWRSQYQTVEQWPEDRPGESYAGPTWEVPTSSGRFLAQPQLGWRFGKRLNFAIGIELELSHHVYLVPESTVTDCVDPIGTEEGIYCLAREPFTAQVGPYLGVRF